MLKDFLKFNFNLKEKQFSGFCMKIQDDFHDTYAVMMEGCKSFCIWLDSNSLTWKTSKHMYLEPEALQLIVQRLQNR